MIIIPRHYDQLDLTLECRPFTSDVKMLQRPFKPDRDLKTGEVRDLIDDLETRWRQDGLLSRQPPQERGLDEEHRPNSSICFEKLSRVDAVNFKRQTIGRVIANTKLSKIKHIAKAANCHQSTVRSYIEHLMLRRVIPVYNYRPSYDEHTQATLQSVIEDPANVFASAGDVKRIVPQCSKRYIANTMKQRGLRYLKTARSRLNPEPRLYKASDMQQLISTCTQALLQNDETLFFLDEVSFPLNNSSEYAWCRPDSIPQYNRRPDDRTLHAIAVCSHMGFKAVQVYTDSINKEAILYFMKQFLQSIELGKRIVVLMDNAGWHHANLVSGSGLAEVILYNIPKMYELNLIENAFAAIKSGFRRRPVAKGVEQEVALIVELFRESKQLERFCGYRRQYLRNLSALANFGISQAN